MEPTYYIRVIRLRWKIIALFMIVGALGGFAFTLTEKEDDAVEVTYWVASHKLIVADDAKDRFPNLLQTALLVTGGEVPLTVAEQLGEEDAEALTRQVRTVTNPQVNVIDVSATSTDPDEAAELANAFADGLVAFLGERDLAAYEAELAEARNERDEQQTRLQAIDAEIDAINDEIDAIANPPEPTEEEAAAAEAGAELSEDELAAQAAQAEAEAEARAEALEELRGDLRGLGIERTSRLGLFESALTVVDDLERAGPPAGLMETLDLVEPYQVSASVYNTRLDQGRRGANNFSSLNVEDGASGGLRIGETVSNPFVRTILGAVAGLFIGVGAVLFHLRIDPRLRTKVEIEEAFDLPVLAEIPKFEKKETKDLVLHAITRSRSNITESYRMVRSALLFARSASDTPLTTNGNGNGTLGGAPVAAPGREMRVIMVTSPGPSEGKTTTTANLAVVLAESGYEVLVINCDYRLPKLHKFFDQPHEARRTFETTVPGVTIVAEVTDPANANPTTVVEAQRRLIEKARERYDVVLLDTAPLLATNDALSLLPSVDLVLLVAREGKTDREAAGETIDLLRRRRARLAGVVLTNSSGFGRSRYYYKYRYGSYYDAPVQKSDAQPEGMFSMDDDVQRRAVRPPVEVN